MLVIFTEKNVTSLNSALDMNIPGFSDLCDILTEGMPKESLSLRNCQFGDLVTCIGLHSLAELPNLYLSCSHSSPTYGGKRQNHVCLVHLTLK